MSIDTATKERMRTCCGDDTDTCVDACNAILHRDKRLTYATGTLGSLPLWIVIAIRIGAQLLGGLDVLIAELSKEGR